MQTRSAGGDVRDDLLAHAGLPKLLQVVGDAADSFFVWIRSKEKSDLIRHVYHVLGFHTASVVGGGFFENLRGLAARLAIVLLPFGHALGQRHLHGGDFVFRTTGGPVGKFGGDHVGAG
jgi:hypothetical protein